MALISCKECEHKISKKTKKCPNCGAPNKRTSIVTWVVLGFFLLFSVDLLIKYTPTAPQANTANTTVEKSKPKHIDSVQAIMHCKDIAKLKASHPSTVEFPWLGFDKRQYPNGRTRIEQEFSAKNAFNLELKFKIVCLFDSKSLIESHVTEM